VKTRREAPVSAEGSQAGEIRGLASNILYEYQPIASDPEDDSQWIEIPIGSTKQDGLESGSYRIRMKAYNNAAGGGEFHSEYKEVSILNFETANWSIDYVEETFKVSKSGINPYAKVVFSTSENPAAPALVTLDAVSGEISLTGWLATREALGVPIYIHRTAYFGTNPESLTLALQSDAPIELQARPNSPGLVATNAAITGLNISKFYEYATADGLGADATQGAWQDVAAGTTKLVVEGNVYYRVR